MLVHGREASVCSVSCLSYCLSQLGVETETHHLCGHERGHLCNGCSPCDRDRPPESLLPFLQQRVLGNVDVTMQLEAVYWG